MERACELKAAFDNVDLLGPMTSDRLLTNLRRDVTEAMNDEQGESFPDKFVCHKINQNDAKADNLEVFGW